MTHKVRLRGRSTTLADKVKTISRWRRVKKLALGDARVVAVKLRLRPERTEQAKPDPLLLEPYNWGPQGEPVGKPFRYIPGKGWGTGEA